MRLIRRRSLALLALVAASAACAESPPPPVDAAAPRPPALSAAPVRDVESRGVTARIVADGALALRIEGVSFTVRGGGAIEKSPLGVLQRVPLSGAEARLDLDLPPGVRLVRPRGFDRVIEIVDAKGVTRARVRADDGALALDPEGDTVRIGWHGGALPLAVLVDWTNTGAPLAIRTRHTATLLPNGDVLVAGGRAPLEPTRSTEIYDGTAGRFTAGPEMNGHRADHTATMRDDGRVLIAGGVQRFGPTSTTELLDALAPTFVPGPSMGSARAGHTATRLADGRVLLAGGAMDPTTAELLDATGTTFTPTPPMSGPASGAAALRADGTVLLTGTPYQIFDPSIDAFVDGPSLDAGFSPTMTRTPSGVVAVFGLCPSSGCSVGGATPDAEYAIFQPDGSFTTASSPAVRAAAAASMLPSGEVLFTGGFELGQTFVQPTTIATALHVLSHTPEPAQHMGVTRMDHTSTLLPSGSTLVLGGAASVDLFLNREVNPVTFALGAASMPEARADFGAVTLLDGSAVIAGGRGYGGCIASTTTVIGPTRAPMGKPRALLTLTLLPDGRVLAVGGDCDGGATAEIYDPVADTWTPTGALTHPRNSHSATLLFDGRVLVAGGHDGGPFPLTTTEIFDPATGQFSPGPQDASTAGAHGASILPSGRVLFVSGAFAGVFDPATDNIESKPLGAAYDFATATLLSSGKVLVVGKPSPNGIVYDDTDGSFTFTGPVVKPFDHQRAILLPSGRVAFIGGLTPGIEANGDTSVQIFDPLAEGGIGGFIEGNSLSNEPRANHQLLLSSFGDVFVIGGVLCELAGCPQQFLDTVEGWHEPADNLSTKPQLEPIAGLANPGTDVDVVAQQMRGLAASSGNARASDGGYPIAIWQSALYGGRAIGTFHGVGPNAGKWRVPSTPFRGPGFLRVSSNAILSVAQPVTIGPAPDAHACSGPHECTSGFCSDGICCDTACDGSCESCSGEINGTGVDGVCAPVPFGADPLDACVIGKGGDCKFDSECATSFCVDGKCCESACTDQCEACDVPNSVGECTAVVGAPHGDRTPCMTAADACENAVCNGVDRDICAAFVGPCEPYACGVSACETTCDPSVGMGPGSGCALNFRCTKEGICVPRQATCSGHLSTSRDGEVVDCAPYNCQIDGTCREACGSVLDCADPFVCDPSGHCVARGADAVDEGCAMSDGGAGGDAPWIAFAGASIAAAIRARTGARSRARRRT